MNYWLNLDFRIFEFLNDWAGQSKIFDILVITFGHYLPYIIVLVLVIYWFKQEASIKNRTALVSAFVSFVIARLFLVEIIRKLFPRDRPFLSHEVIQLIAKDTEKSFPSGHATALFAIAMAVYFYNKKLGVILFILALINGITRVIAGVHFPSDILGGAILGIVVAWLVHLLWKNQIANYAGKISEFSDKILPVFKR